MDATALSGAGRLAADPEGSLLHARLVRARFEALAEMDVPASDARRIARAVDVDIRAVAALLRRGCEPQLVLRILR